jgi:hypothetical protein
MNEQPGEHAKPADTESPDVQTSSAGGAKTTVFGALVGAAAAVPT